jgi:hypothetical protein
LPNFIEYAQRLLLDGGQLPTDRRALGEIRVTGLKKKQYCVQSSSLCGKGAALRSVMRIAGMGDHRDRSSPVITLFHMTEEGNFDRQSLY